MRTASPSSTPAAACPSTSKVTYFIFSTYSYFVDKMKHDLIKLSIPELLKTMESFPPPSEPQMVLTLAETAWQQLRRDIIAGVRKPRERLRIERLREAYGIGPSPLREALQRLAAEGLVMAEGNRGFTVTPLDPREFADVTVARIAVEREAIRLSILNGSDDWEAGVASASYLMAKADREVNPGTDQWERANTAFHKAIVAGCGSNWLLRVRDNLHTVAERYRRASVSSANSRRDLAREHADIARAVLARDVTRACDLTAEHYSKTAEELRAFGS
ncbi:GntR family transcriptional regulator [Meridianimarinicoccus sp. RP-17]|uniref:GntR family transcriptional regulator n=1 Tax=Meridianimarinicoccus zhengii TaxID=2056810 RepID=UPI001C9ACA54|nr:FCD domain-containing protein [Phycocomes zhengii]